MFFLSTRPRSDGSAQDERLRSKGALAKLPQLIHHACRGRALDASHIQALVLVKDTDTYSTSSVTVLFNILVPQAVSFGQPGGLRFLDPAGWNIFVGWLLLLVSALPMTLLFLAICALSAYEDCAHLSKL